MSKAYSKYWEEISMTRDQNRELEIGNIEQLIENLNNIKLSVDYSEVISKIKEQYDIYMDNPLNKNKKEYDEWKEAKEKLEKLEELIENLNIGYQDQYLKVEGLPDEIFISAKSLALKDEKKNYSIKKNRQGFLKKLVHEFDDMRKIHEEILLNEYKLREELQTIVDNTEEILINANTGSLYENAENAQQRLDHLDEVIELLNKEYSELFELLDDLIDLEGVNFLVSKAEVSY